MVATTSHIFSGKVDIASNLQVGSSHLFVDTENDRVGITTASPDATLHVNGNVYATRFEGDGSLLTGIASNLEQITNNGNVTSNAVQFTNPDTGIITTGNVNVGNKLSVASLTPGTVPYVDGNNTLVDSHITQGTDKVSITSNLEITGNILMSGETYKIDSQSLEVKDRIVGIAYDNTLSGADTGILMEYPTKNIGLIHHGASGNPYAQEFTIGYTQNTATDTTILNDPANKITVNVLGDLHTQNNMTVDSGGSYFGDGTTLTGVALETDMTSNAARIANIETVNGTQTGLITGLRTDVTSNASRITTLETANTVQAGLITSIKSDVTSNTARIATLEAANTVQAGLITAIETDVTDNAARITTLEDANTVQAGLITAIETDVTDNAARITTLEDANTVQAGLITTLTNDLSDNTARITTLEAANTVQAGLITAIETDVADNAARITNLDTDLSDNASRVSVLEATDAVYAGLLTGLRTDVDDNASRISNLTFNDVVNVNNATSNTVQFTNPTTALTTDLISNVGIKVDQLHNVNLDGPLTDQLLVYDGTDWVNDYPRHTYIQIRNDTTGTIDAGDAVYVKGTHNANILNVGLADSSDPTKMPSIGLSNQALLAGQQGTAVAYGKALNVATGTFIEGETVYVSNTVPGGLSNVKPFNNDLIQNIGLVTKIHPTNGAVFVTGIGRANDVPNAQIVLDEDAINYVYVNNVNNDFKKIEPSNLLTQLQTLEQVVNTGNTVSNTINVTGLVTTDNVEVGSNISIAGLTPNKIPIIGAGNFLENSTIGRSNGTIVISSDVEILGNITVDGNSYTVESNNLVINDRIIGIANNNTSHELDVGIIMQHPGKNIALIHHGESQGDSDPHDHTFTIGYTQNTVTDNHIFDDSNLITVEILGNLITQNNLTVTTGSYYGDGTTLTGVALSSDLTDNASRISVLETDLTSNASRIGVVETDLASNASRVSTLEDANTVQSGLISTLTTDLASNASRVSTLEDANTVQAGLISTLTTDLTSNASRVSTLEDANTVQAGLISTLTTDLASNASRVSTLEDANTVQGGLISTLTTDLTSNASRVSTLEDANTVQAGLISTLTTDLASNASRIGVVETDLASNASRIGVVETDLASNASRIGVVETDMTSNVIRISDLEAANTVQGGLITAIEIDVTSNALRISSLEASNVDIWSNLASNVTRIETLETANTVQAGLITSLTTDLSDNAGRITTLEDANTVQAGLITAIETDMTSNSGRIDALEPRVTNLEASNVDIWSNLALLTLDDVVNVNNATSNTVRFTNATTSLTASGNVTVSGNVTSTTALISNAATLGTTKEFVVTASGGVFYIDGVQQLSLELHENQTYLFDLTNPGTSHPFRLATLADGGGAQNGSGSIPASDYTAGTDYTSVVNHLKFTVPPGAPSTLYYYCTIHSGMGGSMSVSPTAELIVSGRVVASGNVEASSFKGDGSQLTNIASNLQAITDNGNVTSNTVQFTNTGTSLVASGTVEAVSFIGSGSQLTDIASNLEQIVNNGNVTSNTILLTDATTGLVATGNVEALKFIGDGSELTNIASNLEQIANNGNVTSNTILLTDATTGLVATGNVHALKFIGDGSALSNLPTAGVWEEKEDGEIYFIDSNVGISNADPGHNLSVGSNLYVDDDGSNVLVVTGNVKADYFVGDGSLLTNLPSGTGGVWSTNDYDEIYFIDSNVGISNADPGHNLSVGSNLYVDDDGSNVLVVTGNVKADYFSGDGSLLTNLPSGIGGAWQVKGDGEIYYTTNNVGISNADPGHNLSVGSNLYVDDDGSNVLVIDGNLSAETMTLGGIGIVPSYPLSSVTDTGNTTPHTIEFTNAETGIVVSSNIVVTGNVTAGYLYGDASNVTGITSNLHQIVENGNVTSNTVQFSNAITGLVTTSNVEVGGDLTVSENLTVTGNVAVDGFVHVLDDSNDVEQFPPGALSNYDSYIVGHGNFKTSASSTYPQFPAYKAFDRTTTANTLIFHWSQAEPASYSTVDGSWTGGTSTAATTTNVGGTNRYGQWLQIEFPYKVKYSYSNIQGAREVGRHPGAGCIAGSNDLTGAWTALDNFSGITRSSATEFTTYTPTSAPTQYFKYFRLVIEARSGGGDGYAGVDQWNIFGTREREQSMINDGTLTLTHDLNVRADLYYAGMIRNLSFMEDTIRSWGPHYWWDMDDVDYLEGGIDEGDTISYVHNKSGNWVDNYLTATNCVTRYINGRRFWTGTNSDARMVSRTPTDITGGTTEKIGDSSTVFHVACTSPNEVQTASGSKWMYYHDSYTNANRAAVTWDTWTTDLNGGELMVYNGNGYGKDDGNTRTAGGILGTGSSDTIRAVHCVVAKTRNAFPSARSGATKSRGISNHISMATLTRGNLDVNIANSTPDPGGNLADALTWGNRHSFDRHNTGNQFYAETIIFKRNNGVISQAQVKFLQEYFRFKYQVGGTGLQYSG